MGWKKEQICLGNLPEERWAVSFQSRVGREEWLRPYTDQLLKTWGAADVKSVDVVCPGFSADCLETLEEIDQENRHYFLDAGGDTFRYIPALNERTDHIEALADIVTRHAKGWPEASDWDEEQARSAAITARERAMAMGAEG